MILKRVRLVNFRNYADAVLLPSPGLTVLEGGNAQGKTNLAEAVFLCAAGKSHRTSRDAELVRRGCQGAYIRADVERAGELRRIEFRILKSGKKQIKLDGAPIARISELMGCLNAVLFSPEDLRLVKDGPSERRRFIDLALCQTDPVYYSSLAHYQRALAQRNALLKDVALDLQGSDALSPWDALLALHGEYVCKARAGYLERLAEAAAACNAGLSGGEELGLRYVSDVAAEDPASAISELLSYYRRDDIRRGMTLKGPHRDDFELTLAGSELRAYGSQGQQRTAALALKLAQLSIMKQMSGHTPVLLLDDVLSELDEERQRRLASVIDGCQTILTCTAFDSGMSCGKKVRIMGGEVC